MNTRSKEQIYGHRETFLDYLQSHPANNSFKFHRDIKHEHQQSDLQGLDQPSPPQPDHLTWECILSFMRNVFCHEYSFYWTGLQQLSRYSISYFGSKEEIWNVLEVFYKMYSFCIASPTATDTILLSHSHEEESRGSRGREEEDETASKYKIKPMNRDRVDWILVDTTDNGR